MIENIISFSIRNKIFVGILTFVLICWGIYSLFQLPVDAVPDITNNQVQVITVTPNLATQEVEQFITFPIEIAMSNVPGVTEIRSISRFGLSVVTIVFEDSKGNYLPRQLISEKLSEIEEEIPKELGEPFMGPITTGLGEIYQYTLVPKKGYENVYTPMELRTIQDWIVKRQLSMLPGVVEVNSYGGFIKRYEAAVNPEKLKAMNVTITEIFDALEKNNENTGGSYIEKDFKAYFIRGEGLAESEGEIENIIVKNVQGIPVLVKDVAVVQIGSDVRYGMFTRNGHGEAVGGMIMMLKGANSSDVIERVKERIKQVQASLPEGLEIKPFIDRSELIERTTSTISENLLIGGLIVIFVLVLLLGNYRAGLIVASTIPLAMLFAFGMMNIFGVWINLMSLGAIDFGIIIDGAVIIVEGIVFAMMRRSKDLVGHLNKNEMDDISKTQSTKMMNSAFFGQLIILIVYLPILALTGVEGKMFKPMAYVLIFAMIGVIILCFTYVPVASSLLLNPGKKRKNNISDKIMAFINWLYEPLINFAMKYKSAVIGSTFLVFVISIFLFTRMGGEFLPQLDEGTIAFHIIQKPGTNLSEGREIATKIESTLMRNVPEIDEIVSRFGVSEVPTDPMPMDIADTFVRLKPESEWKAVSKDEIIANIKTMLATFPGINYEFTQPIEMRFNELLTGVREDVAVKIYGDDLDVLARKGKEVESLIRDIKGVADFKAEAVQGLPQISIVYDRYKIARYGINIADLNNVVNAAFGGKKAGVIFEGEKRFNLIIRLKEEYRQSIEHIKDVYIPLPDGNQIPLREVAEISYRSAPMQISRDNTKRRTYVGINVEGRDVTSLVEDIKLKLDRDLELPPGYYIQYGGAFENFREASDRLIVVVPIALFLIFILLYFSLKSFKQTMMIYTAIPLAGIGGILSLYLRGMPFSISAGIGFIALFGVAVLNGLVLINRFNELKEEGVDDLNNRIKLGTKSRLRPILLTASTDILGFLPMAVSASAGAEVQRPLATVVIGGLITSTFLTIVVLPILYYWFETGAKNVLFSKIRIAYAPKIFVLMILFALPLNAQGISEKVNLKEAVDIAVENYPELDKARLMIDAEKALKKSAWKFGDTEFFYSSEETDGSPKSGIESYGLKQSFNFPLTYIYRNSYQSGMVELQKSNYAYSKALLKRNVSTSYFELLFAKSTLTAVESLDSIYSGFRQAAELKYETGETNRLEMINAVTKHRQIQVLLKEKEADLKIALQNFNMLLNNSSAIYDAVDDKLTLFDCTEIPVLNTIGDNSLYNYYRDKVKVQEEAVSIEYSHLLPDINLGYSRQNIQGVTGFYSYEIGISLPLWFISKQGQIQKAEYDYSIAEKELEQKKLELNTELQNLISEHDKLSESLEYYDEHALPLSVEQADFAGKSYLSGEIDYVEYIQNIQQSFEIILNYLDLLKKHNRSIVEIKFLTGTI